MSLRPPRTVSRDGGRIGRPRGERVRRSVLRLTVRPDRVGSPLARGWPLVTRGWPLVVWLVIAATSTGCGQFLYRLTNPIPENFVPNPLQLPPAPDDFVWLQVVDAVDDYFRIAREQPVQHRGDALLDGRIETAYRTGASILEPWRKDSTPGFERWQSTFQSIRRRAIVTLRPTPQGYSLEVVVQKELEDTDRTQYSTESTAGIRHDGTVVRREDRYDDSPVTLGWIPLGRDASLEQVILRDIFVRVTRQDGEKKTRHH